MYPFLTIIIPAYNAERYVSQTLDSILSQSYCDYEIILINDGSTDGTPVICRDYASKNENIILIDKDNGGVAVTRNRGLDIARGTYVMFIDSDDIIYPNTLDEIANVLLKKEPDMLRFDFKTINERNENLYPNYLFHKRMKYVDKIMDASSFMRKVIMDEYYLCMHVFKSSIIKDDDIRFKENCTYNEDTLFIMKFLQYSKKHIYVPVVLYGYRKYSGAVTAKFTKKNYFDVKAVFSELDSLAKHAENKLSACMQPAIQSIGWHVYQEADRFHDVEGKQNIKNQCISSPVILEWKLIASLGEGIALKLYPFIVFLKKLIRKAKYTFV